MFGGTVGIGGIIKSIAAIKRRAVIAVIAFLILMISALGLAFYREVNTIYLLLKWGAILSAITLLIIIGLLIARIVFLRLLYKHSEHLGVNPGDDFENWIRQDILEPNGIGSVNDLKTKLDLEGRRFKYHYDACNTSNALMEAVVPTEGFNSLLNKIKDPQVKIDDLFDHLGEFISEHEDNFLKRGAELLWIMNAFEQRLKAEDKGVTKELVIVSSDITHEIKVEFPGMHKMYWGDDFSISPAKYVRASMSVPFFF
jgi:hypothetical protein